MKKMVKRIIESTYDENGNLADSYVDNGDGTFSKKVTLTGSNASDAITIVPNDAADLGKVPTKGLYIGVSGDVKVTLNSGNTVTFTGLSSGVIHPIAVKRVWATGTTATNMLAVY
jgi:hypothetical protein